MAMDFRLPSSLSIFLDIEFRLPSSLSNSLAIEFRVPSSLSYSLDIEFTPCMQRKCLYVNDVCRIHKYILNESIHKL
jgi:hypothetical protein